MILVLMGAPGSGKGTQAKMLSERYHLRHLSTGDLLREAVSNGNELGKSVKTYLDSGRLVPDEVITGVVLDYLKGHPDNKVLLDGFPRTVGQAQGLASSAFGKDLKIVSVDVPDEEVVDRLSSRRVCQKCGRIYNPALGLQPPGGRCLCGGELIQRTDDHPETIAKRLQIYHAQTEPVIGFYAGKACVVRVKGTGTPMDVFGRLREALD